MSRGGQGGRGGSSGSSGGHSCYTCGETGHYSRDCKKKDAECKYCGAIGHVEFTFFDKKNEAPRMQRKGVRTGRSAFVGEAEIEEDDCCGHGEVVVAKICEGNVADLDDAEKGFLFFKWTEKPFQNSLGHST